MPPVKAAGGEFFPRLSPEGAKVLHYLNDVATPLEVIEILKNVKSYGFKIILQDTPKNIPGPGQNRPMRAQSISDPTPHAFPPVGERGIKKNK